MKVKIGPYVNWIGPYQIAEKLLFWKDKYKDDTVHKFGRWLAGDTEDDSFNVKPTMLYKACKWFESKRKRKVKIHIDNYDTWNAYETIAMIVHPILKEIKRTKQGTPFVDDADVPEHLRSTNAPPKQNDWDNDSFFDDRWDWVLDEMIWTFEQHTIDWEQQYYSGEVDFKFVKVDNTEYSEMKYGPNHTFKVDEEGTKKHNDRIDRGMALFAKYYRCLWN